MIQENVRKNAQENLVLCKACPTCNGLGCRGKMPGPGGRDDNENFIHCYERLKALKINMNFLHSPLTPDTTCTFLDKSFAYPIFAAPIGMLAENFGPHYVDETYVADMLNGCEAAGIAGFIGDGPKKGVFAQTIALAKRHPNHAVPTIKTWPDEKMHDRIAAVKDADTFALATDIDCIGLVKGQGPFFSRDADTLAPFIKEANRPVILKGVMTVHDAEEALRIGAKAIVVSSHGGRLIGPSAAPIDVLPEIAAAVKGKLTIVLDGAIRTGSDVFKALALGADAVLIGRPFVVAAYGGGADAVRDYAVSIGEDLRHTMKVAGISKLSEITRNHIR